MFTLGIFTDLIVAMLQYLLIIGAAPVIVFGIFLQWEELIESQYGESSAGIPTIHPFARSHRTFA